MLKSTTGDPSDNAPKYNVKAVSHLVGIPPVTLRAWERRYGLPTPQRGAQGYRFYSEYDVRALRWLRSQIDAGLSISSLVPAEYGLGNPAAGTKTGLR